MNEIILDANSVGFGVQSTGIQLMAGLGLIPKPDKAYFSNLRETQETIDYIGYIAPILNDMGVPVKVLTPTDIYEHILSWPTADRVSMIPVWFRNSEGKPQPLNRGCTVDFKIEVVASAIRLELGVKRLKRNSVRVWQGISIDEERRAKKSALFPDSFRVNHYPLIGKFASITYPNFKWVDYSRIKLIEEIFIKYGFKIPPKSSCFFCPFHDIEYWYHIYINFPEQWELACILDDSIRDYNTQSGVLLSGPFYLYKGLIPLREIDFEKELYKTQNQFIIDGCNSGFCFV